MGDKKIKGYKVYNIEEFLEKDWEKPKPKLDDVKWSREEKTLMFIVRTIDSCIEKGFLPENIWKNGNRVQTANKKEVDKILKGFEPTQEEWLSCIESFTEEYLDTSVAPKIPLS